METKHQYFILATIILYVSIYFLTKIGNKYLRASSIEEKREEREERIQSFRRIKDFIIKQRLKGARQWRNLHS